MVLLYAKLEKHSWAIERIIMLAFIAIFCFYTRETIGVIMVITGVSMLLIKGIFKPESKYPDDEVLTVFSTFLGLAVVFIGLIMLKILKV